MKGKDDSIDQFGGKVDDSAWISWRRRRWSTNSFDDRWDSQDGSWLKSRAKGSWLLVFWEKKRKVANIASAECVAWFAFLSGESGL